MKNLLLSVALIAAPIGLFAAGYAVLIPRATSVAVAPALGEMTRYTAITRDVEALAAGGDLAAAELRITDLETAWDDDEPTLRPVNVAAWGNVDAAIDDALSALRAGNPDPATVQKTLTDLRAMLDDPLRGQPTAPVAATTVAGVVTTDPNGRALPCEVMLEQFRSALSAAALTEANRATVETLQAKGTERCNADDDKRADDFFAQGIALMSN